MAKKNQLKEGDTVFAIGTIELNLNSKWPNEDPGMLVRSGNGSYYWLYKKKNKKIEIRGVIQEPVYREISRDVCSLMGLVTDSILIYFFPWDLYPAQINKGYKHPRVSAEMVLEEIEAKRELRLMHECPICGSIRPVSEPECNNPDCAPRPALLENRDAPAQTAQISLYVGGGAGVIIGFLLLGIAIIAERVFNAPLISPTLREQYWWAFPVGIGLLGYIGLYIGLMNYSSKEDELKKLVKKA